MTEAEELYKPQVGGSIPLASSILPADIPTSSESSSSQFSLITKENTDTLLTEPGAVCFISQATGFGHFEAARQFESGKPWARMDALKQTLLRPAFTDDLSYV